MKIKFDSGAAGFYEALVLQEIVHHYLNEKRPTGEQEKFLESLLKLVDDHAASPEFDELREKHPPMERVPKVEEEYPAGQNILSFWRSMFGPGHNEMELSRQRIEAMDRAQRAEVASFDALAETVKVARQRDEAKKQIKELKARIAELEGNGP